MKRAVVEENTMKRGRKAEGGKVLRAPIQSDLVWSGLSTLCAHLHMAQRNAKL